MAGERQSSTLGLLIQCRSVIFLVVLIMSCIHGHALAEGGMCAQGHAGGDNTGSTAVTTNASIAELQQIIHQMLTIQNTSMRTPSSSDSRSKAKPERPVLKQNSSDGEWQLLLDSWKGIRKCVSCRDSLKFGMNYGVYALPKLISFCLTSLVPPYWIIVLKKNCWPT